MGRIKVIFLLFLGKKLKNRLKNSKERKRNTENKNQFRLANLLILQLIVIIYKTK